MGEQTAAVTVRISGIVQGVGFRWSAQEEAARLGVDGEFRNEHDGTVTGFIEGPRAAVERMVAWCRRGPRYAQVDDVEVIEGIEDRRRHR